MRAIGIGLLVMAYLLAVADGTQTEHPAARFADPGKKGMKYVRTHPILVIGALCGIVGTSLTALAE